jgi:hypothetical protein
MTLIVMLPREAFLGAEVLDSRPECECVVHYLPFWFGFLPRLTLPLPWPA